MHDINLARVRVTQDYLLRCDYVLIVAKISRAVTDQSLRSSLFLALSRHVPTEWETSGATKFNIAVVCTRTEDINLTAARAEFVGEDKRIAPETMARLDQEIAAARLTGDREKKKAAKREQEILLIRARNDHVREGLQQTYASETTNGETLDVFCVSNKWYEKYCPKGSTALVRASEIPELRRFCHTVAADAMLGEAMYFLQSKLSSLLNSLDLWATSSLARDAGGAVFDSTDIYRKAKEIKEKVTHATGHSGYSYFVAYQIARCSNWLQPCTRALTNASSSNFSGISVCSFFLFSFKKIAPSFSSSAYILIFT